MRLTLDPKAPEWARLFMERLQFALDRLERPKAPVKLPEFANSAALPSASDYRACSVFKKDIDMICVSDGTDWRRVDTGATV